MGLATWVSQIWNFIARGKATATMKIEDSQRAMQPGELLHVAADLLRVLPSGVVQPVAKLLAEPALLSNVALSDAHAKSWTAFTCPGEGSKPGASGLASELTQVLVSTFLVLARLFRIQCRKVQTS